MTNTISIEELAQKVAREHVTVEEKIEGNYIRVWDFHGFEYQARRIARLLNAFGFKAKALRSDPIVKEFKKANRIAFGTYHRERMGCVK